MRYIVLAALLLTACGDHRRVPKESCSSVATGRVDTIVTNVCGAFDSKGNCTVQVPQFTETKEVVTTCSFREWQ